MVAHMPCMTAMVFLNPAADYAENRVYIPTGVCRGSPGGEHDFYLLIYRWCPAVRVIHFRCVLRFTR
jgi:hypothetical protein